jgi:MYXO-CTERM domain-containing protein
VGAATSTIYRMAYTATSPGLVVSPTNVWLAEGDPAVVMVRLATMPGQDVTVTSLPSGGDTDVAVRAGGTLTFTAANWDRPQPLTVVARPDLDSTDDVGTIALSSPGLTSETVVVHTRDDNRVGLQVSKTTLTLQQAASDTFTVALTEQPSLDVAVTVSRSSGDTDVAVSSGASLTFTRATWSTAQTVTITAAADADTADDTATITVNTAGRSPATVMVTVHDPDLAPPDAAPDAPDAAPVDASAVDATAPDAADRDATAGDAGAPDAAARDAAPAPDVARSDARIPTGTGGGGCGCRTDGGSPPSTPFTPALLLLAFFLRRHRRP